MLQSFTHIQFCTVSIRKSQACLWWRTLWWTSTSSGFCISNAYIFRVFGYNQESAKAARNLQRLYTCICCYCFSCWQMSTRFSPPQTDANANASTHAHTCTHRHAHTYTNSICAQKSLRQPAAVTLGTNKNKYNIRNRRAAQCATAANYSIFAHIIYLLRNGIFYCISFLANLKLLMDFLFIAHFDIYFPIFVSFLKPNLNFATNSQPATDCCASGQHRRWQPPHGICHTCLPASFARPEFATQSPVVDSLTKCCHLCELFAVYLIITAHVCRCAYVQRLFAIAKSCNQQRGTHGGCWAFWVQNLRNLQINVSMYVCMFFLQIFLGKVVKMH